ncbi:hypothetical protein ACFL5X_03535, partial [Candidatus Omnitrophota bacterium]
MKYPNKRIEINVKIALIAALVAGMCLWAGEARAVQVKRVYKGSDIYFGRSDFEKTVWIDTGCTVGDTSCPTPATYSDDPADHTAVGDIYSCMLLMNLRAEAGGSALIAYYGFSDFYDDKRILVGFGEEQEVRYVNWRLAEFTDGARVQRGTSIIGEDAYDRLVTLPFSVDLDKSFLLVNPSCTYYRRGTVEGLEVLGEFTSENQIKLSRDAAASGITVTWQVVEFQIDAKVRSDKLTFAGTGDTVTLDPVIEDVDKAFLVLTYTCDTASNPDDIHTRGIITADDTLTFDRFTTVGNLTVSWFLVEFTDESSSVQQFFQNISGGQNAADEPLDFTIDDTRSVIALSRSGGAIYANSPLGSEWVSANLTTTTNPVDNLDLTRIGTSYPLRLNAFVMEFSPLTVKTSNGNDIWEVGTPYDITWKYADSLKSGGSGTGGVHELKIEISNDDTNWYQVPDSSTLHDVDTDSDNTGSYNWTIAQAYGDSSEFNPIGENLRIRITDDDMSARNIDISNDPFIIKGTLDIVQPPDTWKIGEQKNITWSHTGDLNGLTPGDMTIYLSSDGSTFDHTITTTVDPETGATGYSWTIPDQMERDGSPGTYDNLIGTDNLIKIELNYNPSDPDTLVDSQSTAFVLKGRIYNAAVSDNNPILGGALTIDWDKDGLFGAGLAEGTVDLYYSIDGITYDPTPFVSDQPSGTSGASGSYDWDPIDYDTVTSNTARIKVVNHDDPTVYAETGIFDLDPAVVVDEPLAGWKWYFGETKPIKWTPHGSISSVVIKYQVDGGAWNYVPGCAPADNLPATPASKDWVLNQASYVGDSVLVRVCNNDGVEDLYGESGAFSIKGIVSVTAPPPPDPYLVTVSQGTDTYQIVWTVSGNVIGNGWRIKYSNDGGATYTETIDTVNINARNYDWQVLDSQISSHINGSRIKVIRINSLDTEDPDTEAESAYFRVVPYLELSYPVGGEGPFFIGDTIYIQWTPDPTDFGNVGLRYDNNDGKGANGIPGDADDYLGCINSCNALPSDNDPGAGIGYIWNNASVAGGLIRVKVFYLTVASEEVASASSSSFQIKGDIDITYPNKIQQDITLKEVGDTVNIQYTVSGSITSIAIDYDTDSGDGGWGGVVTASAPAGAGNKNHTWNIPVNATPVSDHIRLRVRDTTDPDVVDTTDYDFKIKPKLELVAGNNDAPLGGEEWEVNNIHTIKWTPTAFPAGEQVAIRYSDDAGLTWPTGAPYEITTKAAGALTHDWAVPASVILSDECMIRIERVADSGETKVESLPFTLKGVLDISDPDGSERILANEDYTIEWSMTGDNVSNCTLQYSIDAPHSVWNNCLDSGAQPLNDIDPSTGSALWRVPDNFSMTTKVRIVPNDVDDPTDIDVSAADAFMGKISISQPTGADWKISQSGVYNIVWSGGGFASVSAYYSTQDGAAGTYNFINSATMGAGSIPWNTPDAVGNSVRIKLIDTNELVDTADFAATSVKFSLVEDFTGINPQNGMNLTSGDATSITWAKLGESLANVDLYLSKDNGTIYTFIKTAANTGSTGWNVPTNIRSTQCKIRVVSTEKTSNSTGSTGVFVIKNGITVTDPNASTLPWSVGSTYTIGWDFVGPELKEDLNPVQVKIEYSPTGQIGDYGIIPGAANVDIGTGGSGSWDWNIDPATTLCTQGKIRVTDAEIATATDESEGNLEIRGDVIPDEITTDPPNFTILKVGDDYDITWTKYGDVQNVNFYYKAGPLSWQLINTSGAWNASTQPYTWSIDDAIDNSVLFKIEDASNPSVYNETNNTFRIVGKIALSKPGVAEPDWVVATTVNIQWTPTGTYSSVKIEGSNDDFSTTWPVSTRPAGTSGELQAYEFTVTDHIGDTAKVRIFDSDATRWDLVIATSPAFIVKGALSVTTPIVDW